MAYLSDNYKYTAVAYYKGSTDDIQVVAALHPRNQITLHIYKSDTGDDISGDDSWEIKISVANKEHVFWKTLALYAADNLYEAYSCSEDQE